MSLIDKINRDLPFRLSLRIALAMWILLSTTLFIILYFSHEAMKDDAMKRATNTLERANSNIDNIMLSVEETNGNVFFNMKFDDPERMYTYAHRIVETNPYISGCAIAFKPGFFKGHDKFMAYAYRVDSTHQDYQHVPIAHADKFGSKPYTSQIWYTRTMTMNKAIWLNPFEGMESNLEPLIAVSAPMRDAKGEPYGVICTFVSTKLLSSLIAAAKPSAQSYCALLNRHGSFIVDPTGGYLNKTNAKNLPGESLQEAVNIVMSGEQGYMPFEVNGRKFHLFYKPFKLADVPYRSMDDLEWSLGVAFADDEIFGEYNVLFNYVFFIAIVGIVLLYLHTRIIIRHRLKPLKQLTVLTERIAQGHYDEPFPKRHMNHDEIGMLQRHFQKMQRAVSNNINELHELTDTIQKRSKELHIAYKQAKKGDRVKTAFLHNMTDQMLKPAYAIQKDVEALNDYDKTTSTVSVGQLVDDIQQNGTTITQILNNLINMSEKEIEQEQEIVIENEIEIGKEIDRELEKMQEKGGES